MLARHGRHEASAAATTREVISVDKNTQKYWDMATGLVEATQKRAEPVVRALVKQGEIAAERGEKAVDDLLKRSQSNRKAIASIVRSETEKAVERLGLVRRQELTRLERKVEKLERQTQTGSAGTTKASGKKSGGAKTGGKKSTTKKSAAAKRAARKTAAKKTAERAAPPKKSAPPSNPADS